MTLLEWRNNGERRSLALDMLKQPTLQEMLAVMEAEHPAKQQRTLRDGFDATRILGQIEGFQEALNMIRAFALPLPMAQEALQTTWGADTEEDPPLPR